MELLRACLYRGQNVEAIKFTRPFFDEAYMNYKPEEFESLKLTSLTIDKWTWQYLIELNTLLD